MSRTNVLTLVLVAFGILTGAGWAVAAEGITLEPTVVRLTMKPGEIWRGTVSVTNESDVAISLAPTTANLSRSGEDDTIELAQDIAARLGTLAAWLRPGTDVVALAPGQRTMLDFSIQVPENASPGTHRGLVVLSRIPRTVRENTLSATAAVALGIDLTVVGQQNHHIRLEGVRISPRVGTKAPVTVFGTIANTGNTLPSITMQAEIGRLWGTTVSVVMAPENNSQKVAPGSQTLFRGVWQGEGYVPVGIFKARIIAQDSSGTYESSRYFILVPWQVILGAVAAVCVVLFGRRLVLRFFGTRRR